MSKTKYQLKMSSVAFIYNIKKHISTYTSGYFCRKNTLKRCLYRYSDWLSHVHIIDILITREMYCKIHVSLISGPGAQLRMRICSDYLC